MKDITAKDAIELLRQVVDDKGHDFVYKSSDDGYCFYHKDGNPDCIIGHALFYAGWTVKQLDELDQLSSSALSQSFTDTDSMNYLRDNKVTDAAIKIFAVAQDVQDREYDSATWGAALKVAETTYSKLVSERTQGEWG